MTIKPLLALLAGALVAGTASTAAAAPVHFAITGGYTASFDIDSDRVPDYVSSTYARYFNVGGSFAGNRFSSTVPGTSTNASQIEFDTQGFGGGIGLSADGLTRFVEDGPQLFSGSTSAPIFTPGVYALAADAADRYAASVLTISILPTAAVPEPVSWALMTLGIGAIGGLLRRRKARAAASYA